MVNKVKFERETVVRLASQLFWEKGFNATSTRDLQDAINMRPGSIYSAFGSKEGLYIESLKNYTMQIEDQIKTCLLASPTIIGGLQTFVENLQRAVTPSAKAQVREKYFILLKVILSIASKDLARDEITDAATIYYVKEKILILGSQYPVHHYFAECKK